MTHPLTPREKVPYTLSEISGEIRRRYPAAFDGTDPIGAHPPSLENATDLFLAACLTALASGSGDHAELARLGDRNVELSVLAYKWMEAHDALKSGQPYDYPSPADVPAIIAENAALRADGETYQNQADHEFLLRKEAERKLAEAVGLLTGLCIGTSTVKVRAVREWLSKEAERG